MLNLVISIDDVTNVYQQHWQGIYIYICLNKHSYIVRVVLVIIMEFNWLIGRVL